MQLGRWVIILEFPETVYLSSNWGGFCASTLHVRDSPWLVLHGRQPTLTRMEKAEVFAKGKAGKSIYCLLKCDHDYDNYAVSYNY